MQANLTRNQSVQMCQQAKTPKQQQNTVCGDTKLSLMAVKFIQQGQQSNSNSDDGQTSRRQMQVVWSTAAWPQTSQFHDLSKLPECGPLVCVSE